MLMLSGTAVGFFLGVALGLARRTDWPLIFLQAAVAAAALGFLMRWWGGVWLRGLRTSQEQRHLAETVARKQKQSTSTPKK